MVHVPVRITYVRRDKSHYTAPESTLPIEWRSNLHPQHDNNYYSTMLEHIHEKLPDLYTTQSIYQIEVLYHKPPQEWAISRKRVKVKPDGTVEFEAAIDQPLHSFDGRQTFCPRVENIVDSAFRSGEQNCVVEQLAEKMRLPESQLVELFYVPPRSCTVTVCGATPSASTRTTNGSLSTA